MTGPKVRLARGLGDLGHRVSENRVASGKRNRSHNLDFKNGSGAAMVMGFDDDIIKRVAFGSALELDACDRRSGKPPRLRAHQHGQQIMRTNLSFELAAGGPA